MKGLRTSGALEKFNSAPLIEFANQAMVIAETVGNFAKAVAEQDYTISIAHLEEVPFQTFQSKPKIKLKMSY
jgi:hypothetical protein